MSEPGASQPGARPDPAASTAEAAAPEGLRCDFCGASVPRVRRVALDRDYERLRTPHRALYACPQCSERKEQARRAGPGSA